MYKKIMDSIIDHVALIDISGEITHTNQAWQKFAVDNGGDADKTDIGVNYINVLKASNSFIEYNGILNVLNGKIPFFQTDYTCPSPIENRWFSMIVSPILEEGEIRGATVVHRNISNYEKERLEVHDILESMTEAFISIDREWKLAYINKEAEEIFGLSKERLVGKVLWEEFPEMVQTKFEENYTKTMTQRIKTSFEEYYEPQKIWLEINTYPINNGGISIYLVDINEKKVKEEKLWHTAHHDYLTALPNRVYLYKKLERIINDNSPFVLFFLDLNNFKLINDAYGHEIGDFYLVEIAKRLKEELSENFFVSRFGGDEFILYTAYIDDHQVQSDADNILTIIEKPLNNPNLPPINTSVSIGVSIFPKDGNTVEALITASDTAMYEAKKVKGAQWKMYGYSMTESLNRRLLIEQNLVEAIAKKRLYTVFQPQLNILNNEIIGVEVLSRWNDLEFGFISPEELITITEETGQIRMLTEYIIDSSLSLYNKWVEENGFNKGISFNVSNTLLSDQSFVSFLLNQLKKHSISRDIVEIEITENIQVYSSSIIRKHLDDIKQAGIRIAIDDFGVGYSNISYLSNLPITKIKIDQSFTSSIGKNPKGECILQAMIALANNLKIDVLVEGVETHEQRDFLLDNNCSLVQGFLYDRPLTNEQIISHLQKYGPMYPNNWSN